MQSGTAQGRTICSLRGVYVVSRVAVRTQMKQLDGLRAVAIFFTLVTHFFVTGSDRIERLVPRGQFGARPLFVISGFLITRILLRSRFENDRWGELGVFYMRRLLRIVPLYYTTLVLAALVNVRPVRQTLWWHLAYLSNLYQIVHHAAPHLVTTAYWSLSVEEQFYLVWPCLILFLPRRHLLPAMIATVMIGPLFRMAAFTLHIYSFGALPFSCMDALGVGALLAYCQDKDLGSPEVAARFTRGLKWVGPLPFAVFLSARAAGVTVPGAPALADLAAALTFGWVVSRATSSFRGPVGWVLELGPIRYVGRISYGIYILHSFMPVLLFYMLRWTHLSLRDESIFRFLLLVCMSVGAASISWRYFESPINAYKRFFEYARSGRTPRMRIRRVEYTEAVTA
jgi:peptidoglycan/LPS O-acetylase OafA/YrhL